MYIAKTAILRISDVCLTIGYIDFECNVIALNKHTDSMIFDEIREYNFNDLILLVLQ